MQTFTKTNAFDDPRRFHNSNISGMSTSYTDENRAYVAFSVQGGAKIVKTEDLGATWTDISGFSICSKVQSEIITSIEFDFKGILFFLINKFL